MARKEKTKTYRCLGCGLSKLPKEFPKHITSSGRASHELCWDCLDADEDGYVVQLS